MKIRFVFFFNKINFEIYDFRDPAIKMKKTKNGLLIQTVLFFYFNFIVITFSHRETKTSKQQCHFRNVCVSYFLYFVNDKERKKERKTGYKLNKLFLQLLSNNNNNNKKVHAF